jgi:hypothetical protein
MGLDMYAYSAARAGQDRDWWDGAEMDPELKEFVNPKIAKPKEIAYWRKHPNLHGWFHQEWIAQGNTGDFNGDELEITWDMLDRLEQAVKEKTLPGTQGFFFGESSDDYYREQDLEFIQQARAELFLGLCVFYNSSW